MTKLKLETSFFACCYIKLVIPRTLVGNPLDARGKSIHHLPIRKTNLVAGFVFMVYTNDIGVFSCCCEVLEQFIATRGFHMLSDHKVKQPARSKPQAYDNFSNVRHKFLEFIVSPEDTTCFDSGSI